jgi:hypothetical protein
MSVCILTSDNTPAKSHSNVIFVTTVALKLVVRGLIQQHTVEKAKDLMLL